MAHVNNEDMYLNRAKFVMKILGVWMPLENETRFKKIYRTAMMFLQYIFLIFQTIFIFQVWGDLEAVSEASYLLFTQACLCFKITVFQIKIPMLRDLLKQMNADIFRPQTLEHINILILQATRIKRFLLAFMVSSQITCGMWALKPLFDNAGKREFPFDMWMPVSSEYSPQYELGYGFQLITICMSAYMYFGVDSVALSMVIFGCAQIDIVKAKILSIKSISNSVGTTKEHTRRIRKENYNKIIECITQHQAVLKFIQMTENTYHAYLFFQLTGSVGLICMSALRLVVVKFPSIHFFSIVFYVSVMISQLFICCWCGHELTATSEELFATLYQCLWYEQDFKFKRDLRFMMMCVRRPVVLKVGNYITLSRQTFVSILRMSYSYFAVLNSTEK
uniref:Odorant receptor n=1 Tax=Histia rhodope TaxID=1453155 RepID=A0A7G4KBU7_9NEOP|nr:odorant receptor [Histia rhodope]